MLASRPNSIEQLLRPAIAASALILTLCAAHLAGAQDVKPADTATYTLSQRLFKAGDVSRYKLTMRGQDSSVNLQYKETTKEAGVGGTFTLLDQFESATANVGGTEQDFSAFLPTITITRDKAGKLTSKAEGGAEQASAQISAMLQSFATMQNAYLPKTPVKVGDTWKVTSSTPGPTGGAVTSKGDATLIGTEVIFGVKSVKIKIVGDVDTKEGDIKAHSEALLNLVPETGKLLKMTTKVDGTTKGMKVSQELEMTLLPADKAAVPEKK